MASLLLSQRSVHIQPGDAGYWTTGLYRTKQEMLVKIGVLDHLAKDVALNAIDKWTIEEVKSVLGKFPKDLNFRELTTVKRTHWIERDWIKAPIRMMSQAAEQTLALCVNRAGEWDIRSGGYAAISHVWSEGIWGDSKNRGLPREVLKQVFDHISKAGLDANWLWLDPLAIPGGLYTLTRDAENIKVATINNMAKIYEQATEVVVLDSMLMQMPSTDPMDVAFALLCGKWRTRLWTYQEAKLANKVLLVTGSGPIDYHEMINRLGEMCGFDKNHRKMVEPPSATEEEQRMAKGLYIDLRYFVKWEEAGTTLRDVTSACRVREASYEVDNALALYPSLHMQWSSMTRGEGIAKIYRSRRQEALELVLTWGSPRSIEGYAWAPAYLNGLHHQLMTGNVWEPTGIRNTWHVYKVKARLTNFVASGPNHFAGNIYFELDTSAEGGEDEVDRCKLWIHRSETVEARNIFLKAVEAGQGYILTSVPMKVFGVGGTALLVKKSAGDEDEVSVCMTVRVGWVGRQKGQSKEFEVPANFGHPQIGDRLLKHQSPLIIEENDVPSEKFGVSDVSSPVLGLAGEEERQDESAVQLALRSEDITTIKDMIEKTPEDSLGGKDSKGWTALHTATYLNLTSMVVLLVDKKMDVNALTNENESPLTFACRHGNLEMATTLITNGATINPTDNRDPPLHAALDTKSPNHTLIYYLLDQGADPNHIQSFGVTTAPIFQALRHPKILQLILTRGADVNLRLENGRSALSSASSQGYSHAIPILVSAGLPIDTLDTKPPHSNALYVAVTNQQETCIKECLRAHASVNRVFGGETCLIQSAKLGNYEISSMLIREGAKLDAKDTEQGATPLIWAVSRNHARVAKLIVGALDVERFKDERKRIMSMRAKTGETAKDIAERAGSKEIKRMSDFDGDGLLYKGLIHTIVAGVFSGVCWGCWKGLRWSLRGYYRDQRWFGKGVWGLGVLTGGVSTVFSSAMVIWAVNQYREIVADEMM